MCQRQSSLVWLQAGVGKYGTKQIGFCYIIVNSLATTMVKNTAAVSVVQRSNSALDEVKIFHCCQRLRPLWAVCGRFESFMLFEVFLLRQPYPKVCRPFILFVMCAIAVFHTVYFIYCPNDCFSLATFNLSRSLPVSFIWGWSPSSMSPFPRVYGI